MPEDKLYLCVAIDAACFSFLKIRKNGREIKLMELLLVDNHRKVVEQISFISRKDARELLQARLNFDDAARCTDIAALLCRYRMHDFSRLRHDVIYS